MEIKQAYIKLAKQYHPDVNRTEEAAEMFSKINEAHETLSDAKKRKIYDRLGMSSNEQQNVDPEFKNMGSFSWSDLWTTNTGEDEESEEGVDYD